MVRMLLMEWSLSKLALYAQENCNLMHSLSDTEFKGCDDMAKR